MAINTYALLKAAIASHLHRDDLTAVIPDFIAIAEENLSADLFTKQMDLSTTLSTVAGVKSVTFPTDLVETRRLLITDSYNTVLSYRSPDEIAADYSSQSLGRPAVFTVVANTYELAPVPDAVYSVALVYKQRIPALSDTNQTNWLISGWASCYLYASLMAAQPYIINDERYAIYEKQYKEAIKNINEVDWYSGTSMRVKVR